MGGEKAVHITHITRDPESLHLDHQYIRRDRGLLSLFSKVIYFQVIRRLVVAQSDDIEETETFRGRRFRSLSKTVGSARDEAVLFSSTVACD
jgi:hypothetical protein